MKPWTFPEWMRAYLPLGSQTSSKAIEFFMNLPTDANTTASSVAIYVRGSVETLERLQKEGRLK